MDFSSGEIVINGSHDTCAFDNTHDISEAISMSDKIIVLSKRPASVKSVHEINLVTEGEKTPLKTRKVPQFQYYFDILWKELDSYEIKQ